MSKTQYLQQLGQSWYLRVKVPADLQDKIGNTHLRRALRTRDLDEANRRKWPALTQVRGYFDSLRASGLTARAAPLVLDGLAPGGMTRAKGRLQLTANGSLRPSSGLDALAKTWAATSHLKTVQFQRLQAYRELRGYLGDDAPPEAVSYALAAAYVDERLSKSSDSPATRRRKLSALSAFWEWMGSRGYTARGLNPWKGFRLSQSDRDRNTPKKRAYAMDELIALFSGTPSYAGLRELMVLGLYTGARIDELCSLTQGDLRIDRGTAYLTISKSKTHAGARTLALAHPLPLSILRARLQEGAVPTGQLFPELRRGGYDQKLSWGLGQAFRYHRNGRGLSGATDFHSLRRTFITQLENLGVDQVRIARYVGHSLPTLAFALYSGGATEATQQRTGRTIKYPREVEAAVRTFIGMR